VVHLVPFEFLRSPSGARVLSNDRELSRILSIGHSVVVKTFVGPFECSREYLPLDVSPFPFHGRQVLGVPGIPSRNSVNI